MRKPPNRWAVLGIVTCWVPIFCGRQMAVCMLLALVNLGEHLIKSVALLEVSTTIP